MSEAAVENKNVSIPLSLSLSPIGHLYLYSDPENKETALLSAAEKTENAFALRRDRFWSTSSS